MVRALGIPEFKLGVERSSGHPGPTARRGDVCLPHIVRKSRTHTKPAVRSRFGQRYAGGDVSPGTRSSSLPGIHRSVIGRVHRASMVFGLYLR